MITLDETASGTSVDLNVGQMVELRLPENRSTGYRWRIESDGGPACHIVDAGMPALPDGGPGVGGMHLWRIEGAQAGQCNVALAYARPWETGVAPVRSFTLHVAVSR
jgi:inhibitor of cysteine peptidase